MTLEELLMRDRRVILDRCVEELRVQAPSTSEVATDLPAVLDELVAALGSGGNAPASDADGGGRAARGPHGVGRPDDAAAVEVAVRRYGALRKSILRTVHEAGTSIDWAELELVLDRLDGSVSSAIARLASSTQASPESGRVAPRSARASSGAPLRGVRVLFVDDEPDARMLGSLVLCRAGARVHEASSAEEALESLGDKTFDVVVSDLGMPRMDGFDLMRSIRGMVGPISRVRSLALTAFARAEDKRRAIDAGFDQHLAKPADPAVLIAEVAKLVSLPAPLPMH